MSATYSKEYLINSLNRHISNSGLTLAFLAEETGTQPSVLSKLLNGTILKPDLRLIKQLCGVLNLSYRDLLYDSPLDYLEVGSPFPYILARLADEAAIGNMTILSNELDVSKQYLNKVMHGEKPSDSFLSKAASYFGLTYDHITGKKRINLAKVSSFFLKEKSSGH